MKQTWSADLRKKASQYKLYMHERSMVGNLLVKEVPVHLCTFFALHTWPVCRLCIFGTKCRF